MYGHPKASKGILGCEDLVWETPGGRRILDGLTFSLGSEKTALVGKNGSGKTTLVKLLIGELQPLSGSIQRTGTLAWLPQGVEAGDASIARGLGIDEVLRALAAIADGQCDDRWFELVANRWDLPERAAALLDRLGLPALDLHAPMARLSGGEAMRVALAGCLLAEPALLILDEPTNHLDTTARQILYDVLDGFHGGLLVISHDRALLRRMERTLELSSRGLKVYGGGWEFYRRQRAIEHEAARHGAEVAATTLKRQVRAAQKARERQDRRAASGKRSAARRGASKLEIQAAQRRAEKTRGRLSNAHAQRVTDAKEILALARASLPEDSSVRVDLGDSAVPSGKIVVEAEGINMRWGDGPWLWPEPGLDIRLTGPARLSLEGPSGCGKSTLARILIRNLEPQRGRVKLHEARVAWLDQHCRILPPDQSLMDSMLQSNPGLSVQDVHWILDKFQLGKDAAKRLVGHSSGGERMRAALACLFGVGAPPRLLVLDEPTNNLDLETIEVVEQALAGYRGALIIISHDEHFLEAVGVRERLDMWKGGRSGAQDRI